MRIAIVCPYDFFRHGGVQEHIRAVSSELRSQGHYVKVIAPNPVEGVNSDPDNVITIGSATPFNTGTTSVEVSASASPREIEALFEREQFDIVNFHEPMIPMLAGQLLSRSPAINVATFHAAVPPQVVSRSWELISLPYAQNRAKYINYITAVSEAASVYISKSTDNDIHIIPNGIELAKYQSKDVGLYEEFNDDVKTILYIGRLEKRKGVEYLLKAYSKLKETKPNTRLVICGDGPKMKSLLSYIDDYDIEDVHFLGFVSEEDKLSLLKTCDVFCSPALYGESFGIVLLEAMAMGAPIVAGSNPGYSSVMKETGRISLVDPKTQIDFVHTLEYMLFDEKIRTVFKDWTKEYIKQFDYKEVTKKYLEVYEALVADEET